jgi:hypothetical protein
MPQNSSNLENISYFLTFGNQRFPMLKRKAFDSPKKIENFFEVEENHSFQKTYGFLMFAKLRFATVKNL